MKFTVADLLDQLSTEHPSEPDQLAKILKLSNKTDKAALELAVSSLMKIGVIEKTSEGGLTRPQESDLIDARLRCSSKGFCFAIRDDGGEDIYIRDHQLNHAWNGDRVLVRVTREGGRRRSPEGGVQCILERATHLSWLRWSSRATSCSPPPWTTECLPALSCQQRIPSICPVMRSPVLSRCASIAIPWLSILRPATLCDLSRSMADQQPTGTCC